MPTPPLADELIGAAGELEALDPHLDAAWYTVSADTLNRAARLLRTAADVVTVAYESPGPVPSRDYVNRVGGGHVDDSGI